MKNVLIPNIGRRGYLVRYLKSNPAFSGKVFVSDCDATASGLYGPNDGHFIMSRPVDDPELYITSLIELCGKYNIGVIIPVIDPEIFILAKYREYLDSAGIFVSVSNEQVLNICYNKEMMNEFLKSINFNVPQTFSVLEDFRRAYDDGLIAFPVMLKPIYGSGSVATYKVESIEELTALFQEGAIIQEYLEGVEYGVDVFNDVNGNPIRCIVKKKISMRSGETDKSVTIYNEKIQTTMLYLAKKLGHICNLDSDVIVTDEKLYVIDLNPRFGGGYPATHEAGVDLLELVIKMSQGITLFPEFDNYVENLLVMKEVAITKTLCIK